jgi:hypothetical protein
MMNVTMSLLAALIFAPLGLVAQETTPDEILRQRKSGVDNGLLLDRVKSVGKSFSLSADDIVALAAAGVSEEVIQFMLRGPGVKGTTPEKAPSRPPAVAPVLPSETDPRRTSILLENKTSSALWARLDTGRHLFLCSQAREKGMVEVPKGESARFDAPAGDFEAQWRGTCACLEFNVSDGNTSVLQILEKKDEDGCVALFLTRGQPPPPVPVEKKRVDYVCPHHPDVHAKEPGACPKCGMKLELRPAGPKTNDARENHDHSH